MNMDFKSAKELLDLCEENQLPISEVMRQRECLLGETPRDAVDHRMAKAWEIMRASATQPLKKPIKSMGGLIGGEAKKLETHYNKKKSNQINDCSLLSIYNFRFNPFSNKQDIA